MTPSLIIFWSFIISWTIFTSMYMVNLFSEEQTGFMTAAYFQDVRPDWLEVVEE